MTRDLEPVLVPRPRVLERRGGAPAPWRPVRERIEPAFAPRGGAAGDEAYALRISRGAVALTARAPAGLRHAHATLAQLRRQYPDAAPELHIEDWPCFPTRGVMLDVSRDRVPTMEHLREIVGALAALKFNHLQLYTEHTFAYSGHEDVWRDASPMTADEVRRLDAWCREAGIELAANQNCFGHLSSWLRLPRYAHLAETHGEWDFENAGRRFPRSGPFSLCPTDPRSLEFVRGLLDELLPCFTSQLVNIGCDETFDVGAGRSRDEVARRGRAAVYFDFVRAVADVVRAHGRRPMFWADIALSHPDAIGQIREDMICLAWGYEPEAPFGEWCRTLRGAGREAWVCPGTSSWRSIVGRTAERRANLMAAASEGVAAGAAGYLVTDWGDMGHRQQWPISLHAVAEAAEYGWAGGDRPVDPRAISLHVFGDESLRAAAWLDELGDADADLRRTSGPAAADGSPRPLRNAGALFTDLHRPLADFPGPGSAAAWRPVEERLRALRERIPPCLPPLAQDEFRHAAEVALWAAHRAIAIREGLTPRAARDLAAEGDRVIAEHERLWLSRSRPGGLDRSTGHYRSVMDEMHQAAGSRR